MNNNNEKVALIVIDGLRPDAALQSKNPFYRDFGYANIHDFDARTVKPSVTFPAHMSIFHSVPPERHLNNTLKGAYVPSPVMGLCEVLHQAQKSVAFYYDWEELRDLGRPGSMTVSVFYRESICGRSDKKITDAALRGMEENPCDFTFIHIINTDDAGHNWGWMTDYYKECVAKSGEQAERIIKALPEHHIILMADHGGHDDHHKLGLPVDMTIPIIIKKRVPEKREMKGTTVLDIAPTVCKILGVEDVPEEWEGKSLI